MLRSPVRPRIVPALALAACALGGAVPAQLSFKPLPVVSASPPASPDTGLFRDMRPGGELVAYVSLGSSAETWGYVNGAWSKLTLPVAPPPRSGFAVADTALFGGRTAANTYLNDTWAMFISPAPNVWTQITSANGVYPPGRSDAAFCMGYGLNLLMGGRNQNGVLGDCWQLKESWVPPNIFWNWLPVPAGPSPRYGHGIVNHPGTGFPVLFGGRDANGNALDDTWIFDGSTWTRATPATRPPARSRHTMGYDYERRRVVVFGGLDQNLQPLNDAWDWTGTDWVRRSVAAAPAPRADASLCYHAQTRRCALFGGGGTTELWSYGTDFLPEWVEFGSGCVYSEQGSASLWAGAPGKAVLGGSLSVSMSLVRPNSTAFLLLGGSNTQWQGRPLPLDLGPLIGTGGCRLYTSVDFVIPKVATIGSISIEFTVPNDPALAGVDLYWQGLGELLSYGFTFRTGTTHAARMRIGAY